MARTLKVGVSGSAPFVIREDGANSGVSLEVWRRIAEENNLSYRLIQQGTPQKGIRALNDGEIDLRVGPISITPDRLNRPGGDFTQPYFIGKEGILLPLKPTSLLNRFQVFLGWAVLSSVLVLITVLLVVGSLIWLAERRSNSEQFPAQPLPGIASGMWFALVTLTTVGYGDKAPITRLGRGLTAIWMVTSLDRSVLLNCEPGVRLHPVSRGQHKRQHHGSSPAGWPTGCSTGGHERRGAGEGTGHANRSSADPRSSD